MLISDFLRFCVGVPRPNSNVCVFGGGFPMRGQAILEHQAVSCASDQLATTPTTSSLGLINLLERFTELRKILNVYHFNKGYHKGCKLAAR